MSEMIRKILAVAVCLVSLSFFSIASAEMRLVTTDSNGYKTYFDTESLYMESEEILDVRVVGRRPDNSVIMDEIFKFKIDSEGNAYSSSFGSDWRLFETDADTVILEAVLDYIQEMEENEK